MALSHGIFLLEFQPVQSLDDEGGRNADDHTGNRTADQQYRQIEDDLRCLHDDHGGNDLPNVMQHAAYHTDGDGGE